MRELMRYRHLVMLLVCSGCFDFASGASLNSVRLDFMSTERAAEFLVEPDDFIIRLSPFDMSSRMKTDGVVRKEEFLKFIGGSAVAWTSQESDAVSGIFAELGVTTDSLNMNFPERINLIMTSGVEEGNAAYTRGNAIILQRDKLSDYGELKRTIAHEVFHLYTRHNPDMKNTLYNLIGFHKIDEIEFPNSLLAKKLTNPDAPINDYAIQVTYQNASAWVVPILYSYSEEYLPEKGGEFFEYLQFKFVVVGKGAEAGTDRYDRAHPVIVDVSNLSGFFEQIGTNTNYIIHPEEILADNFAMLAWGVNQAKSPEILQRIRRALSEPGVTQSTAYDPDSPHQ